MHRGWQCRSEAFAHRVPWSAGCCKALCGTQPVSHPCFALTATSPAGATRARSPLPTCLVACRGQQPSRTGTAGESSPCRHVTLLSNNFDRDRCGVLDFLCSSVASGPRLQVVAAPNAFHQDCVLTTCVCLCVQAGHAGLHWHDPD
jgi:hypothetical protein